MTIEMITALAAAVLSLFTLVYTIIENNKQSLLQTVTINRMDWIQEVRKYMGDFARAYRTHDVEAMLDAEAQLEPFMRRDVREFQNVLNHLRHCIKNEYNENDYEKLLTLSAYTVARMWQIIRIETRKYHSINESDFKNVNKNVQPLLDLAMSYDKNRDGKL